MDYKESQLSWSKLSLAQQMANIGADVGRSIKWHEKGKNARAQKARDRALELFDMTMGANKSRSREIARAREVYCDYFFNNEYKTSVESWESYFLPYNYLARINN